MYGVRVIESMRSESRQMVSCLMSGPQLGVMASYSYSDGLALNGESSSMGSFSAMASLSVPIYHWGEGRGKVRALKAEQEMSRLKREEMSQLMPKE